MHPTPQTLRTAGPFSGFAQRTWMVADAGTSSMSLRGHAATHLPQPTHSRFSTLASPSTILIACWGQAFAHAP